MRTAATYNLNIDRAASFGFVIIIDGMDGLPVDVSAAQFYADARDKVSLREVAPFTIGFPTDGTDGQISMSLSTTQTKLFREGGSYEYDLFMVLGTTTYRLLKGDITCSDNITNEV